MTVGCLCCKPKTTLLMLFSPDHDAVLDAMQARPQAKLPRSQTKEEHKEEERSVRKGANAVLEDRNCKRATALCGSRQSLVSMHRRQVALQAQSLDDVAWLLCVQLAVLASVCARECVRMQLYESACECVCACVGASA
jgi:hypothetical protein